MDTNNSAPNTPSSDETSSNYQNILDQYSKQITITPEAETESDNQVVIDPNVALKTITPEPIPTLSPPTVSLPTVAPIPSTKESNLFKILFFISLLIFLGVASALALSFVSNSKIGADSVNPVNPTVAEPTNPPETETFCYLNDNKYKLDETFPSADGCNTCTCSLDGTIACTEKACNE